MNVALRLFGSLGIAGMRKKNGGVGRASPAQHPHIFPYFPAIPNEPLILKSRAKGAKFLKYAIIKKGAFNVRRCGYGKPFGKMESEQMLNWLKPKINIENISPEIESMLQRFEYGGLTSQDDPINQIALDIMRDDFKKSLAGKAYTNIYQFKVDGRQFYLCDRAMELSLETRRHVCILAAGKAFPLGFEITTDEYTINNDCEAIETIGNCNILVDDPDEYEGYKSLLLTVLPHCERFSTSSNPVAFFSFPEDKVVGYHVSGRQIASDEAGSAVALLQKLVTSP